MANLMTVLKLHSACLMQGGSTGVEGERVGRNLLAIEAQRWHTSCGFQAHVFSAASHLGSGTMIVERCFCCSRQALAWFVCRSHCRGHGSMTRYLVCNDCLHTRQCQLCKREVGTITFENPDQHLTSKVYDATSSSSATARLLSAGGSSQLEVLQKAAFTTSKPAGKAKPRAAVATAFDGSISFATDSDVYHGAELCCDQTQRNLDDDNSYNSDIVSGKSTADDSGIHLPDSEMKNITTAARETSCTTRAGAAWTMTR